MLRTLLLQAFYSGRSERKLVEQLDYNLLLRWFVGVGMGVAVWNNAVLSHPNMGTCWGSRSKSRDRLTKRFMIDEHFTKMAP